MRTGLLAWFAALAGLAVTSVQWEDEPRSLITGVCGLLAPVADVGLGQVEAQHAYDSHAAAGEEIERTVGGPRVLTLALKLDGYDQRLPEGVFFALASVATKLRGADSLAALRAMGLAVVSIDGPRNVARVEAGRTYPRAVLDVRLGYTRVETITPITWIETVKVESRIRDEAGTLLPSPPNGITTIEAA